MKAGVAPPPAPPTPSFTSPPPPPPPFPTSSQRVLTAEWIDGCKATDKEGIERRGLSVADVRYHHYFLS